MTATIPSREEKIEAIRTQCVEANPDIVNRTCNLCKGQGECNVCWVRFLRERPIRLADVLLAAGEDVLVDIERFRLAVR